MFQQFLITKKFIIALSYYFWNILVLDTDKLYAFVCLIYFIPFMLFASMTLLDMTKKPSFILLSKHMCYTTTMALTFCIFHMHLFKWCVHYQVSKLPLSELWELMVDGKKSVLSRILVISSLPHSREFKRLSTSLFLLSMQSSAVGVVKLRCYYHQGHSWGSVVSLPAITSTCFQTKECSVV